MVQPKHDRDNKLMMAFHDIRGAIVSASASVSTGTGTSLIAGDSDKMLDLIEITLSNNSTVAAQVSLTNDGTIIKNLQIPVGGTLPLRFDAPLEQVTKNTPWLVDMEDITGTTVVVNASFIKREK
jgi:hypothetical protein